MGNGATRSLERVAAAMGQLESAPVEFQAACDVSHGGVLLALPALLAAGLLRRLPEMYQLPNGFYGIESIFVLLALLALARIRSLEQLRYQAPGEWGKLLGMDRVPEVRTLRAKLKLLCQDQGTAMRWNAELAKEWIARQNATELYFYCDGHVRVYHGEQTALPRHYVARERLCLRATTDYWINAMDGQPFLYVNKEVDPGLITTLKQDVIPWLEANVAQTPEQQRRLAQDPRAHWFTVVFDREGYSPELFEQMRRKRIAILTYHKFPKENWRAEEFVTHSNVKLAGGETVTMQLAERGTQLSNKLWVREIRKLTDNGHQTSILTTNFQAPIPTLAVSLFARWSQENFFRYMKEHFGLDRLIEYGTEPIPDAVQVVNPPWRKLDSQLRSKAGKRHRLAAQFGALALSEAPTEPELHGFQQRNGQLREEIQILELELGNLKLERKNTPHHIPVKSLSEQDQFTRLRTERKHFIDTIKMIAYRAESSMASLLCEHLARTDDARTLLRQIFDTEADLTPDLVANTLTVRLHHLTQATHDRAIEQLLVELNATQTIFPGTTLMLVFKLGSS